MCDVDSIDNQNFSFFQVHSRYDLTLKLEEQKMIRHIICITILLFTTNTFAILSDEESLLDSVCNGNEIVVNGIAATCVKVGYTYVAGAFTRIEGAVNQSFNFGRYDEKNHWEALPSLGLGLVKDLDSMVDLESEDERKILAYVRNFCSAFTPRLFHRVNLSMHTYYVTLEPQAKTMICPKERDYIILGGHFAFVQNRSEATSNLFNQTYVNVSNVVLFDVQRRIYVPLKTSVQIDQSGSYNETLRRNMSEYGVSVSSTNSLAIVNSLSCVDERYCSRVYMGGLFDYAFGVRAGNIVGFSITYPNISSNIEATHASVRNVTVVGRSGHVGVDGIVMAVQTLSENRVVFGGAFPSIAGDFSASLGVWNGLNSTENDTFTNYGCVPTMGKHIAEQSGVECVIPAVCCHGIGGFVFALERISKDAVMVGGEFEMSFSHAHAKNLVQIVYVVFERGVRVLVNINNTLKHTQVRLRNSDKYVWMDLSKHFRNRYCFHSSLGSSECVTLCVSKFGRYVCRNVCRRSLQKSAEHFIEWSQGSENYD